jgi:3-oxoacyl-[acyl-carrier-protein] synthase-3
MNPPPESTVAELQRRCGLARARGISVAHQNCVSPIVAMRLAQMMTQSDERVRNVLIVVADQMRSSTDQFRIIDDGGIHSDGACAVILSRDWPRNEVLGLHHTIDGRFFTGRLAQIEYNERYYWATVMLIREALAGAGLQIRDISRLLPHHVNLPAWKKIVRLLRLPEDVLFESNFARIGHVFGCDALIDFVDSPPGVAGETILLYSSGLGGCHGAVVLRR